LHHHSLYGLVVGAGRLLPAPAGAPPADITIREHGFRRRSETPPTPHGYSYSATADSGIHVSWSDLFDFVVSPDGSEIDVYTEPAITSEFLYTHLITQVMSVALLQKGIESFHASAVEIDGRALVLLGGSGHGKSTLTAALVQRGAHLITDDLLIVERRGEGYAALRGAGRLKLSPETAGHIGVQWKSTPMSDGSGKHIYMLPEATWSDDAVKIARMVVLRPHSEALHVRVMSAAETTPMLLAAVFNPLDTRPARLAGLLTLCRDVASAIECVEADIPRDLAALPRVISAIT
jgi:hypothetical protein